MAPAVSLLMAVEGSSGAKQWATEGERKEELLVSIILRKHPSCHQPWAVRWSPEVCKIEQTPHQAYAMVTTTEGRSPLPVHRKRLFFQGQGTRSLCYMTLFRRTFPHREKADGSYDSICTACMKTVATSRSEAELSSYESDHICSPANIRRIAWHAVTPEREAA